MVKAWQASSLEDCFYESYLLAQQIYKSVTPEQKLGYRYNYVHHRILDEQLLKGGVRLAAMLNEIFD
jgi:hypothetical protein